MELGRVSKTGSLPMVTVLTTAELTFLMVSALENGVEKEVVASQPSYHASCAG
jgi:hypothetical protein